MPVRIRPLPYRSNPQIKREQSFRVQDQQTAKWTYAEYLVTDDFGTQVDGRYDGFDWDKAQGEGCGLSSVDIQGGSVFLPNGGRED